MDNFVNFNFCQNRIFVNSALVNRFFLKTVHEKNKNIWHTFQKRFFIIFSSSKYLRSRRPVKILTLLFLLWSLLENLNGFIISLPFRCENRVVLGASESVSSIFPFGFLTVSAGLYCSFLCHSARRDINRTFDLLHHIPHVACLSLCQFGSIVVLYIYFWVLPSKIHDPLPSN